MEVRSHAFSRSKFIAFASLLFLILSVATTRSHAELARVGPTNNAPGVGGFPAWYQDKTGIAMEFCDPKNQAELDGGWCLLVTGDANIPENFPTNFFDEHFFFSADSTLTLANGGKALLVLAVEAAFAGGAAKVNDQIMFSRIRVRLDPVPVTGNYRFVHPYGEDTIFAEAGDRIFMTDDVGVNCTPGQFDCALASRIGPFLLPSNTPGGTELSAISGPVPGKLYIADPARIGPVTGSKLPDFIACPTSQACDASSGGVAMNHNVFRIEGPSGAALGGDGVDAIQTTDFSLMGRLFTGTIGGRVTIDGASYTRNNDGQQVDVFATGFETTNVRLPGQAQQPPTPPRLAFFASACAVDSSGNLIQPSGSEIQMFNSTQLPNRFWGQAGVATPTDVPIVVCIKDMSASDANGPVATFLERGVTDDVTVTSAVYDPGTRTLSVSALSSDKGSTAAAPAIEAPTLTLQGFNLADSQLSVSNLAAPPRSVTVRSSARGIGELHVSARSTGNVTPPPDADPQAHNDVATVAEDSTDNAIDVLANDSPATGTAISITSVPRFGVANIAADASGKPIIRYTPNQNVFGTDIFDYTYTADGRTSNIATVTVTITGSNDQPTAVNDSISGIAGSPISVNLLANDSDRDGAADLANLVLLSWPAAFGPQPTPNAGIITFTPTVGGTFSFTYNAVDKANAVSLTPATVTVTVTGAETIAIAQAEFRTDQRRLRISGTITPVTTPAQTVSIRWANGTNTSAVVATATADVTGAWAIDIRNAAGIQDPRNTGATSVRVTGPNNSSTTQGLTIRR
jgi:hypothetical protein